MKELWEIWAPQCCSAERENPQPSPNTGSQEEEKEEAGLVSNNFLGFYFVICWDLTDQPVQCSTVTVRFWPAKLGTLARPLSSPDWRTVCGVEPSQEQMMIYTINLPRPLLLTFLALSSSLWFTTALLLSGVIYGEGEAGKFSMQELISGATGLQWTALQAAGSISHWLVIAHQQQGWSRSFCSSRSLSKYFQNHSTSPPATENILWFESFGFVCPAATISTRNYIGYRK